MFHAAKHSTIEQITQMHSMQGALQHSTEVTTQGTMLGMLLLPFLFFSSAMPLWLLTLL